MDIKNNHWIIPVSASSLALLWCAIPSAAHAESDAMQAHLNRLHHGIKGGGIPHARAALNQTELVRNTGLPTNLNDRISLPGHISHFLTNRPVQTARSVFLDDAGNTRNIRNGISLDLSSTVQNITLGRKSIGESSITIEEGGQTRVLSAGSTVTAAELAALNQKIETGSQGLELDGSGAAAGGSLNLNAINGNGKTIRASELVIPTGVSVNGDLSRTASGVIVKGSLINYGSIELADSGKHSATIAAREINNQLSGSISTVETDATNLRLRAETDLNNAGTITSSGDLVLSAGGSINNKSGAVARSNGNLFLDAAVVNNQGTLSSNNQNVTFSAPAELAINNTSGTVSALAGNINVRDANYDGLWNSTVTGGDLLSKELNLNSGNGTIDLAVSQLTGKLNSAGKAVHASTGSDLILGTQCLTGDPAYFTVGNLTIGGNITVGENLAIVASGSISTSLSSLAITARDGAGQGYNIYILAGVPLSGFGPVAGGNLPGQPPITQNTTGTLSVSGGTTASGGNIDFSSATTSMTISSNSTGANQVGGDIVMAAAASSSTGIITLPANSIINASGSGTAASGNIDIFVGKSFGQSLTLGSIINNGGGAGGNVRIFSAQPSTSDGKVVIFDTTAKIISGNSFDNASRRSGDFLVGNISSHGDIRISTDGDVTTGDLSAADIRIFTDDIIKVGNVSTAFALDSGTVDLAGSSLTLGTVSTHTLIANANDGKGTLTLLNDTLSVAADSTGKGGSMTILANVINPGSLVLQALGTASGDGGEIIFQSPTTTAQIVGGAGSTVSFDASGGLSGGAVSFFTQSDITVNAGGINVAGKNGNGSKISLATVGILNLIDTAIVQQDATAASGNGGQIGLSAFNIIFTSSAATPLVLSANGTGTGNGGFILFNSANLNNMVVGPLLGKVKGATDFLTVSATSGSSGGNGGDITVRTDGSIQLNPAGFNASPQGPVGDGAILEATAGAGDSLSSSLVIVGDLDASGVGGGIGGLILLGSSTSSTFEVGATKTPKNGIFGTLTAAGPTGEVDVFNSNGGVKVNSTNAISKADVVYLEANANGSITAGKNTVITAAVSVDLNTFDTGSIGKKPLNVSAPEMFISSGKSVNVNNIFTGPTFVTGDAIGSFTVSTNGPTTISDIFVDPKGNIKITSSATNGGLLKVDDDAVVSALSGAVTLVNLDTTNGSIEIGMNALVETAEKGKTVTIAIGPAPKKGTNPVPPGTEPAGIDVTVVGKGVVFFGSGGVQGTNSTVDAINKPVIFSNLSTGGQMITLSDGASVIADPPSKPLSNVLFAGSTETLPLPSTVAPAVAPAILPATANDDSESAINTLNVMAIGNGITLLEQSTASTNLSNTPDLNVDASIHKSVSGTFELDSGNVVLAPASDLTVKTPHGDVLLKAGSVTLLMASRDGIAVYNLHDRASDSVILRTGTRQARLLPGQHAHVHHSLTSRFEDINAIELVLYRGIKKTTLDNGYSIFSSEFSIPSACYAVKPLRALMTSKEKEARRLAQQLNKTAAILRTLRPDNGDFVQFFKTFKTAMR